MSSPLHPFWGDLISPERDFLEGQTFQESGRSDLPKVALLATGPLVYQALLAARELEKEGVWATVVNVHTIKPLDEATIVAVARKCGAVVTIEEHQIAGGFGSAVAELLARTVPTSQRFVGVHDAFGQSGEPAELIEHYGMAAHHIVVAALEISKGR